MTEYWRSLGELEGAPDVLEAREREFPEGAADAPDGISRRSMLGLMGATLSLSGLAACRRPVEKIVPYVQAPEHMLPGIPVQYATTMPFRGTALGLLVQSHEGRPTKIEGNERHPATQGASNLWAQAAIYDLYDPDRARTVSQAGAARTWKDFVDQWGKLHGEHVGDGGAGLAILAEPSVSPTELRLLKALKARFPSARIVVYAPLADEPQLTGLAMAAGSDVMPVHRLADARVILSLDADFLLHDREAVRLAREFAAGRRDPAAMNRLYVAESTLTTTGVNADHRLPITSSRITALALAIAAELGVPGATRGAVGLDDKWVSVVAKDLEANAGRSLVLAGAHQPAEVHAAVAALNGVLGNVGKTVRYVPAGEVTRSRTADLASLVADLGAGKVKTLVVLGGNPAYDAPADLDFAGAAAKATNRIRLGSHVDETSAAMDWHLPQAHFLESWGDARTVDGTRSVIQPLIEPLFGGRSTIELLAILESGTETPGYDLVRETWKPLLDGDFERSWARVLHDGLLAGNADTTGAAHVDAGAIGKLAAMPAARKDAAAGEFELVFHPAAGVYDGRGANNAWLQELPEPVSKLTWDNVACVSQADAAALGLVGGQGARKDQAPVDLVTLELDGRSVTVPALVLPGQAAGSISLALGYGRTAAGRIGNGVGANAYALRTTKALGIGTGLTVKKAGGTHALAITSEHWGMEGRDIVREQTAEEAKHPHHDEHGHHPPIQSPWTERSYEHGPQWGMTIDLSACIGCNACILACQSENNIPSVGKDQVSRGREMHWIRVDRYFSGRPDAPESVVFQPVPCMHCENAPCEQVCPVAATVHSSTGLNEMVYNRCIGTRYCSNNCPYKVRRFNFYNYTKDTPTTLQIAYNPDVTVRARGVMEKCTYCVQRLERAQIDAKLAGKALADGDVRTACQQSCPAQAIEFGDLRDPKSRVVAAKQSPRKYDLLAEFNTKPRTSYLTRLRNPNPELSA